MKRKVLAISLTLAIVLSLFTALPIKSQYAGTLKIGIVGPMAWIQGMGMWEGASIAVDEIMAGGGIEIDTGVFYDIELVQADTLRGKPDPDGETGSAAGFELVAADVDFVYGGFRTESSFGIREVVMDAQTLYFICGSATDELVDCGGTYNKFAGIIPPLVPHPACGACVRDDYAKYKYVFRNTPMNSSNLGSQIATFFQWEVMNQLLPLYMEQLWNGSLYNTLGYGQQKPEGQSPGLKYAVVSEALAWTASMHAAMTSSLLYPILLGPYARLANVTPGTPAAFLVSPVETDLSGVIAGIAASGAHLVITVLSGPVGRTFITQARDAGLNAMFVGIDVPGQEIPTHWDLTGGDAEYETFLATAGQETPTTAKAIHLYTETMSQYGHAPIYTSYGVYDSIKNLAKDLPTVMTAANMSQIIHASGSFNQATYDNLIPFFENTYQSDGIGGQFQYTPGGGSVPGSNGTYHDLYVETVSPVWGTPYGPGYATTMQGQWQNGRLELTFPIYGWAWRFAKRWQVATYLDIGGTIYDFADSDITGHFMNAFLPNPLGASALGPLLVNPSFVWPDGVVSSLDLSFAAASWQASPATLPGWDCRSDMDGNYFVNIADISAIAADLGKSAPIPPPGAW